MGINAGHEMMLKKRTLGSFGWWKIACGGLVFACAAPMALCVASVWPTTRTPAVDMYELMIDLSAFPEGWRSWFGPVHTPERAHGEHGEREALYIVFYPQGLDRELHFADHTVFRYRNELDAAIVYYGDFRGGQFRPWNMITPWAVPEKWSYESVVADRLKFACGELDMSPVAPPRWDCTAVAQYDEFISIFATELSPDYMTLEDVERILVAIDERMAFHLGKNVE